MTLFLVKQASTKFQRRDNSGYNHSHLRVTLVPKTSVNTRTAVRPLGNATVSTRSFALMRLRPSHICFVRDAVLPLNFRWTKIKGTWTQILAKIATKHRSIIQNFAFIASGVWILWGTKGYGFLIGLSRWRKQWHNALSERQRPHKVTVLAAVHVWSPQSACCFFCFYISALLRLWYFASLGRQDRVKQLEGLTRAGGLIRSL